MENSRDAISFIGEEDSFKMQILKKRIPARYEFLKGMEARNYVVSINQLIYFYRNFETRLEIKRGDVFLARFAFECGNELKGDHFVAALLDSSPISQVVTVIPLKSAKGRPLNPASDILLGKIEGLNNGKETIAVINQIRTIDKRRLFDAEIIAHLNKFNNDELLAENPIITCQYKKLYRLSEAQYKIMHKAAREYVFNGYIRHE